MTETSPGSYALGYSDGSSFIPFYVGRADSDLNRRLHEWVDAPSRSGRAATTACESWRLPGAFSGFGARTRGGIRAGADSSYTCFTFRYSASAADAFEAECRDYHDLGGAGGLDNRSHPEPPLGTPWECPLHR